ncbi:MAG TPA: hypothetical protein VF939_21745 [Puia sp.]
MAGLVTPQQAAGMGGAGKPAGAQADNTFQNKEVRQLMVLVRYKPKPPEKKFGDLSAAESMTKGVTGAIESAVGAIEDVMSNIPGLEMFIKEKKKDSTSQKDYQYDYSDWDSKFSQVGPNLKKLNSNNKTDTFEFSSTDADGRKKDAKNLFSKVSSKLSEWSGYPVWIHFIGIGQGAHVVNECTDLLAKDGGFKSEKKCCVKSVIYAGSSLYKNEHVLNTDAFKGAGQVFSFGNNFDLTQHAVDYFEPNDKLVQMIKDSNKNTLSLAVGKVKLRVIKILSLVLGGLNISIGNQDDLNKFDLIKSEITGMVDDIVGLIKKISTDTAAFIKLGDLPEFGKMMDGYGEIPGQCEKEFTSFIDQFISEAGDQVKKANVSLGPQDLANVLNCLCPLFDHITKTLSLFNYKEKTGMDLARQIIDNAGVTKVYAPADQGYEDLSKSDPYYQKFLNKVKDPVPDLAVSYMAQAKSLIAQSAEKSDDIKSFSDDQKIALAEAIFLMARPMTLSKEQVYKELLTMADGFAHFDQLTKNITTNKLTDIPAGPLKSLNINYPPKLEGSIEKNNQEVSRIKGYFNKSNFGLQEDSQYFIFNSHNLLFNNMPDALCFCIDRQTTFLDYQKSVGLDNEFTDTGKYKYNQAGSKQKENVMPAQPLPL